MRLLILLILLAVGEFIQAQQLQFHRDFRHAIDPELNSSNFFTMNFEYFNDSDAAGSFLFKTQADFNGENGNISQVFIQASKNLRFWKPKLYLSLGYSGGLGLSPPSSGYHIANSYSVGVAFPVQWKRFYLSIVTGYRYNAFPKGSNDGHLTLYFWKGIMNYKLSLSGSFVSWTQNRNIGTDSTQNLQGKKFAFFADPQIWYKVWGKFSAGTRINCLYHVVTDKNQPQFYPTLGIKFEF
jgi:hypothetical protein